MKLVIGGAYQGKLNYARNTWQVQDGWADGRSCDMDEIYTCRGMNHFHEYIRRLTVSPRYSGNLIRMEEMAGQFAAELMEKNRELILISNELGYGVVPVEKQDRRWRELTGRILTDLAAEAEEVVRVVCGIGVRIK